MGDTQNMGDLATIVMSAVKSGITSFFDFALLVVPAVKV